MIADGPLAQGRQRRIVKVKVGCDHAAQVVFDHGQVLRGGGDDGGRPDQAVTVQLIAVIKQASGCSLTPCPVPAHGVTSTAGRSGRW